MKNMRVPIRPAPSAEEARRKQNQQSVLRHLFRGNSSQQQNMKKKPPPRPPPPDFSKLKPNSGNWNPNNNRDKDDDYLIEWSPPSSPRTSREFGGSVSSSFNSSTSSLASSKKSFEFDSPFNVNPWNIGVQAAVPTIIRPQPPKKPANLCRLPSPPRKNYTPPTLSLANYSPPMPTVPPPSPPKEVSEDIVPFGLAIYNYPGQHPDDLPLQENDIVYLLKRVNVEWLYGRVGDREGMFPASFVEIKIPLPEDENLVTALYDFKAEIDGDLSLVAGQQVKVLYRVSDEWLMGESNGFKGQFPANFVDRIPDGI